MGAVKFRELGVYDVTEYGATGDGVVGVSGTPDMVAVVAANAAAAAAGGGDVYFPGGRVYRLYTASNGQSVVTPGVNVRFIFGAGAVIDNFGGAFDAVIFNVTNDNTVIEGATFTTQSNHNNAVAIRITSCAGVKVRNCTLVSGIIFVYLVGSANHVTVEGNKTTGVYGVLTQDSATAHHVTVRGNFFSGPAGEGVEINTPTGASTHWNIVGNMIEGFTTSGTGGFGIAVAHGTKVNIVGNYISDMTAAAIRFEDGTSDVNCVGNYIYDVQEHGVYVLYGNSHAMSNITVHSNFIHTAGQIGTASDGSRASAIMVNSGGVGLFSGFSAIGNYITNCGVAGTSTAAIDILATPTSGTEYLISGNMVRGQLGNVAGATPGIGFYLSLNGATGNIIVTGNIVVPVVSTDRPMNMGMTSGTASATVANNGFLGGVVAVNPAAGTWVFWNNVGYKTQAHGATSVADGGTISHGLGQAAAGLTPSVVTLTGTTAGDIVSVNSIGASTFAVAIKKHDGTAGTTATVHWRATIYAG